MACSPSQAVVTPPDAQIVITPLPCQSQIEAAVQRADAQAVMAARTSLKQQSGLVFSRTNALLLNAPKNRVGSGVQAGVSPDADLLGGAGQAADGFCAWADFTWSAIANDDAAVGLDAHAFTLSGGYDVATTDRIVFGAAVNVGGAIFDPVVSDDDAHEVGFGVTPYIAYQLDDVFSLQAAAGWNHARGRTTVDGGDGRYSANRYFVAGEAAAFKSWGATSLFSSVGVLWGQSFQGGYTTDTGLRVGSARTDLGSLSVTAQPSYLATIDEADGVFVEPYLLGQYSYDFAQTKIRGAANDADEFVIGAGVNGFFGATVSGALEFTRTLGREDQTTNTARATGRLDF